MSASTAMEDPEGDADSVRASEPLRSWAWGKISSKNLAATVDDGGKTCVGAEKRWLRGVATTEACFVALGLAFGSARHEAENQRDIT
jgi:hypothetical protein